MGGAWLSSTRRHTAGELESAEYMTSQANDQRSWFDQIGAGLAVNVDGPSCFHFQMETGDAEGATRSKREEQRVQHA